jgi:hypothetical protein
MKYTSLTVKIEALKKFNHLHINYQQRTGKKITVMGFFEELMKNFEESGDNENKKNI